MQKFLFILFLLPCVVHAQVKKDALTGTWKYSIFEDNKETYTPCKAGEGLREFTFKADGSISYSQCTDMCGCLAETFYGTYSWKGNNLVIEFSELALYMMEKDEEPEKVDAKCTISVVSLKENELILKPFRIIR